MAEPIAIRNVKPAEAWAVFLGDPAYGAAIRSALTMVSLVPPSAIREALSKINTYDAAGSILDPTGYREVVQNIPRWREMFNTLLELRHQLPDPT